MQTGDISRLRREALERRELAEQVRSELPEAEAGHVVSAHLDDQGRLVIGMDSSAWAARLRYSVSELCGRPVRVRVSVPGGGQA
ncbi:MAG TPA: DciA family protein [Gammaproteobacteria bacterium]|nr:DciA family protein [Gammaproteobacteria bacterium]